MEHFDVSQRQGQENQHRGVDNIRRVGTVENRFGQFPLAVEPVAEQHQQGNDHRYPSELLPDGIRKALPMYATHK